MTEPSPRPLQAAGAGLQPRVLLAGVDKDTRGRVEAEVRQALGERGVTEPWTVSLVRLAGQWSVTLNGPGARFKNVSLTAEDGQLVAAIREAVAADIAADPIALTSVRAPVAASGEVREVRESHECSHCRRNLVVVYETHAGEPKDSAPAACPHCWKIGHFDIGAWAAAGGDYRCEKA